MAAKQGHEVQRLPRCVEHSLRLSMIIPTLFIQRCLQGGHHVDKKVAAHPIFATRKMQF
uniref:Uncharacterized protein n=1 Tax=Aegilops tauschii TaxID=37682 RepID=M8D8Q6_AEGTA